MVSVDSGKPIGCRRGSVYVRVFVTAPALRNVPTDDDVSGVLRSLRTESVMVLRLSP